MTRPVLSLVALFDPLGATVDLSALGREGITVRRGVSSIVTTGFVADAGTYATTLDNIDRHLDPNNLAGPYVSGGISQVVPGVPVTPAATWNGTPYGLIQAFADGFPQSYPLDGNDQAINFHATDPTGAFANISLDIRRPAEYSGARIAAIVAASSWPGGTSIAHGNCVVGPLKLGTISAWSHLTEVANAEWGELYFDKSGVLVFRDRDTIASDARSTVSQATFVQSGGLNYSDLTMGSPPIVNDCTVTYSDLGHQVRSENAPSIAMPWGRRSLPVAVPISTATVAQQYADWITSRYGYPLTTFASITLTPANEPGATFELWTQALSRELGDLITVTVDPLSAPHTLSGDPITRDCWIRGIEHNFASEPWSTTFYLQDASWLAGLAHYDVSTYDGPDVYSL